MLDINWEIIDSIKNVTRDIVDNYVSMFVIFGCFGFLSKEEK